MTDCCFWGLGVCSVSEAHPCLLCFWFCLFVLGFFFVLFLFLILVLSKVLGSPVRWRQVFTISPMFYSLLKVLKLQITQGAVLASSWLLCLAC